jgi:hypothetical protein
MAKLSISPNLAAEELDLLEAAGFESDQDLLSADPEVVHRELVQANEMLELAADSPPLERVQEWIASTRDGGASATKKAAKKTARKAAKKTSRKTAKKTTRKSTKKTARKSAKKAAKKAAKKTVAKTAPALEDEPVKEATAERLDTPVNFEADPDVQEMLDRAPVALPISNRMLADAGIRPAEILAAPLLNRAESDLEVNVSVGEKKRELAGMPKRRASGVVQVADFRPTEKVGFDASRVRHIDETHDDPSPPARPEVDERTRLIRTAKETTNRGRDPKSKRYVRGVLHDRGLKVLIGCITVLLLQVSIPLAVVAAPLLILSDVSKEGFEWVPQWLIAFPIAVPVFGILYFAISFRVRCRVCSQRLLAPRQCLKNRKAHHIPLLGYIFALALHAVFFRWFNCTYCGTAVRIKE